MTHDGGPLRMLVSVDEFTRECLSIGVARNLNSDDVLERLPWLMSTLGVPKHIRSDNGAEFTSDPVREWLGKVVVKTLYIEPGSPWENGCVESFNSELREVLLCSKMFDALSDAKALIEQWRRRYSTVSPHSSLGYRPPAPETSMPTSATHDPARGSGQRKSRRGLAQLPSRPPLRSGRPGGG